VPSAKLHCIAAISPNLLFRQKSGLCRHGAAFWS